MKTRDFRSRTRVERGKKAEWSEQGSMMTHGGRGALKMTSGEGYGHTTAALRPCGEMATRSDVHLRSTPDSDAENQVFAGDRA
jgi:hypothetical protein